MISIDLFNCILWHYRAVITQNNAGATDIGLFFDFIEGSRALLIDLQVGKDDYAAGRAVQVDKRASGARRVLLSATIDNQRLQSGIAVTLDDTIANTAEAIGSNLIEVFGSDYGLYCLASSLAQNETFSIDVLFAMRVPILPTLTIIGAGATKAETFNRFI